MFDTEGKMLWFLHQRVIAELIKLFLKGLREFSAF